MPNTHTSQSKDIDLNRLQRLELMAIIAGCFLITTVIVAWIGFAVYIHDNGAL